MGLGHNIRYGVCVCVCVYVSETHYLLALEKRFIAAEHRRKSNREGGEGERGERERGGRGKRGERERGEERGEETANIQEREESNREVSSM